MMKKASYILSTYSFLSTHSADEILNVGYQMRNGNPIPSFDENLLIDLCSEAQSIFEKEENVLELNGDFLIVGDIHGSFHDLLRILNYNMQSESKVLFLGDYVDRGNYSLECITLLFALKVMYPDMVYLLRGNHEFDAVCSQYGFKDEILNNKKYRKKLVEENLGNNTSESQNNNFYTYTESLYNAFINAFDYLPICALLNQTTFCVHGGLSPNLHDIDEIKKKIKRPIHSFEQSFLFTNLVWSDPCPSTEYPYEKNPRGYGFLFNSEAINIFFKYNPIKRIIRAHQLALKGIMKIFECKCLTVFSSSHYKNLQNDSAIIRLFEKDDSIKSTIFPPIDHLSKSKAFFYKVQPPNQIESKSLNLFSLHHPKLISNAPAGRIKTAKNARPLKLRRNAPMISSSMTRFVTNPKKSNPYLKNSAYSE